MTKSKSSKALPIQCPECNSKIIVKKGLRKNKFQTLQQYQCKNCSKIFKQNLSKYTTYSLNIILNAISYYNLGYTFQQTKEKLKISASLPTISLWLKKYGSIIAYNKLRKQENALRADNIASSNPIC